MNTATTTGPARPRASVRTANVGGPDVFYAACRHCSYVSNDYDLTSEPYEAEWEQSSLELALALVPDLEAAFEEARSRCEDIDVRIGRVQPEAQPHEPSKVPDLMAALEASLAAVKAERRPVSSPCPQDPDGLHHIGCGCEDSDVLT